MHETATYGIRTHTHVVATCYRSQLSSWLNSSQLCSSVDQPLHCYWLRACHGERPCAGLYQQPCSLACAFIISSARALASCLVSGLGSACHRYRFSLRPARVMIAAALCFVAPAPRVAPPSLPLTLPVSTQSVISFVAASAMAIAPNRPLARALHSTFAVALVIGSRVPLPAAAAPAVDSAPAPSQPRPHRIATAPTARNGSLLTSCHHRNRPSPPPP